MIRRANWEMGELLYGNEDTVAVQYLREETLPNYVPVETMGEPPQWLEGHVDRSWQLKIVDGVDPALGEAVTLRQADGTSVQLQVRERISDASRLYRAVPKE